MKNIKYILFGIIAALGALIIEMLLSVFFPGENISLNEKVTLLLFLLVITEELFKFSVILKSISADFFLLPSFFISAGFALTEISLAYFKNTETVPANLYMMLAGVGVIHLTTGLLSGYSAFYYKRTGRAVTASILLFFAIILHLIYNAFIINL